MPIAYIYVRVSHRDSANSGISPEAQTGRAIEYYKSLVEPEHRVPLHSEVLYDAAISASRVPLLERLPFLLGWCEGPTSRRSCRLRA